MEIVEVTAASRQQHVSSSGVVWSAVLGGAAVTAALSLLMLALGAGFGLSTVSPWSNVGASAATLGGIAVVWLILTQIVSSAMGGYLAGRLRTRWQVIHNDEVHFRDTANGFLAWAVAVVVTVAFLTATAASMAGMAAAHEPSAREGQDPGSMTIAYFADRLFRSDHAAADDAARAEAGRTLGHILRHKDTPPDDAAYLAQLVSAKTGMSAGDATRRVSDTINDLRQTEDDVRKATAHALLWIFLALLIGAFCASYAATVGGRQRDRVQAVERD